LSDTTDVLPQSARESSDPATTSQAQDAPVIAARRRSGSGLSAMVLPELQALASSLGIAGVSRLRKGQLIAAIQNAQNTAAPASGEGTAGRATTVALEAATMPTDQLTAAREAAPATAPAAQDAAASEPVGPSGPAPTAGDRGASRRGPAPTEDGRGRRPRRASRPAGTVTEQPMLPDTVPEQRDNPAPEQAPVAVAAVAASAAATRATVSDEVGGPTAAPTSETAPARPREDRRDRQNGERSNSDRQTGDRPNSDRSNGERPSRSSNDRSGGGDRSSQGDRPSQGDRQSQGGDRQGQADRSSGGDRQDRQGQGDRQSQGGDRDDDFNNRRRGRFRERGRNRGTRTGQTTTFGENEPVIREDDVLVPVGGILDVLDNYAFVRTSGYLTGPNDVYVSLSQVRRNGLRRGDAITGVVRAPQEGEQRRDKYNALVRLDSVNGMDPAEATKRPEFTKLTPLYPQDRLRLETEPQLLTTRIIDLLMPIGKGQRALIVSPPKAGKTMVLQAIANAITTNNPEVHLMVVLVDERPEEVTDMQRSVKGEVVASTFDRPPSDHTSVAELSIERAKRLVELGHDVVVLLDSITRLGRAYNLAAPASGRILSGGVDSTALYPPKRFLGAARNIENGGSLTIIATALVETGSTMDTVIFEEFKGTGNAELKLDRKIADKRVFPAVDVNQSSTRKEEILLAPEELAITHNLRRVLHALDAQQAIDLLIDRLKQNRTNYEFLMTILKTTPGQN
jgi:transcription termination factor Rho